MKAAKFAKHGESARELLVILEKFSPTIMPLRLANLDSITITVEKFKRKRTLPQNARYWAVVTALADYAGMSKERMHDEVKCEIFDYRIGTFRGEQVKIPLVSSADLSVEDFGKLLDVAEQWAVQMNVAWQEDAA